MRLLFSPKGRLRRRTFWRVFSLYFILGFFLVMNRSGCVFEEGNIALKLKLDVIAFFVCFYIIIVAFTKRLHDLNKSGWFSAICIVTLVACIASLEYYAVYNFFSLLFVVTIIIIGVLKGTEGENKYGSDPLEVKTS